MTDAMTFAVAFPQTAAVFEQGRGRGLHHGLSLYVSVHAVPQACVALGDAEPGRPLSCDAHLAWLSAGKPLTAAAWARAWEQGLVQLDELIARVLPEFAANGKAKITWRHVLTHTAGLRTVDPGYPQLTWDETIARICAAPIDAQAIPGQTAGYHVSSTWFLLGEALQRWSGAPFAAVLEQQVLQPLGMTQTRAVDPRDQPDADAVPLFERVQGALAPLDWHQPPRSTSPSPGSSLRGPLQDLGRFYEGLLQAGRGERRDWLSPTTVAALTTRHRVGEEDLTLGHMVDFGLGFILDSNRYGVDTVPYGYGRWCSPRTFGHGGAQCAHGFCDPEYGLVVAWAFNGRPGEGQHQRRAKALNEAIYLDLGIAKTQAG